MKKNIVILVAFALVILASCKKTGKPTIKPEDSGEKFMLVPCSVSEDKAYASNDKFFRANAFGESLDQMVSKRKAMTEARTLLAASIETTIKSVVDNYIKDVNVNTKESLEKKYEGVTREVVKQQLNDVRIICEKQSITAEKNYKTYVAIEMDKEAVQKALADRVSRDEELKVDYDYEKFKKTFDEEMEKRKQND